MVKSTRWSKKNLFFYAALLVIAFGVAIYFIAIRSTTPRQSSPTATIKQLPPQKAANNGEKKVDASTGNNQGTSTDNHGITSGPIATSPSQWKASQSGAITLKQPVANDTIKSGATVSGSASVDKVQYRLIDNRTGVISQGFISVVDGSFSASISFQSHGANGRLDVFSISPSGAEDNEVQIAVNF